MGNMIQGSAGGNEPPIGAFEEQSGRLKTNAYVQLRRNIVREFIIAIVSLGIVYAANRTGLNVAPALFPFAIWAWVKKQSLWQARIAVLFLCGGSDVFTYLYFTLLMIQVGHVAISNRRLGKISKFTLPLFLFVGLAAVSWIVNQVEEINLLALPLWAMSFLSSVGVFFYFRKWPLTGRAFYRFLVFLISIALLQCFIGYVDYIGKVGFAAIWSRSVTPDGVIGTFRDANTFCLFLLQAVAWCYAFFITHKSSSKLSVAVMLLGLVIMLFIYTGDGKTQLAAFLIAFICVLFFNYRWRLRDRSTKVVVVVIAGALLLGPMVFHHAIEQFDLVYVYYLVGTKNKKVQFMSRAIDSTNRSMMHWLIGYGPGTCGSRASNMRAYDLLPKNDTSETNTLSKYLPAYSSQSTRKFIADLYTRDYALSTSGRSALLGNPFNSWTAIWFELGLIGFLLWVCVFAKVLMVTRRICRSSSGLRQQMAVVTAVNVIAISVAALITQTIEIPTAMMFLWFFAAHIVTSPMIQQTRGIHR